MSYMTKAKEIAKMAGKTVSSYVTFMRTPEEIKNKETFGPIHRAEDLLIKQGYIYGSMCRDLPIGFAKADKCEYIAKWRNISETEYVGLSGIILPLNDFRDEDTVVVYFE